MADNRGVRSSSRRITPSRQLPGKATSPQTAPATRRRGTRSASHGIEEPTEPTKSTRRSARQTSVDSVRSENDRAGKRAPRTKKQAHKEAVGDLTTVEEVDTQIAIEEAPATPPRPSTEVALPHRSPAAVSEMSGTTAISSFTMVEAEMLEPRFMLRHLPKLYHEVVEFLDHLVPVDGSMQEDFQHIQSMQIPGSDFVADYNDFDQQLSTRLAHYRGDGHQYILIRAVHAALFGSNRDTAAAQTGLDLVLYQANLIIFAKDMIHTDRNDKNMLTVVRELDNYFPTLFLPALVAGSKAAKSPTGASALLQETFQLALELRTQLAILHLEQGSSRKNFDPDAAIDEVFLYPDPAGNAEHSGLMRGWGTFALGGEDKPLPDAFANQVVKRMEDMRNFFLTDQDSLERGESVDLDGLGGTFPWNGVIARLLGWARSRNAELQAAIKQQGGVSSILGKVKTEIEQPTVMAEPDESIPRRSPRKSRSSFGRRRRSSGRFDPNAEVNDEVLNKLIGREGGSSAQPPEASPQPEPQIEEPEPMADNVPQDQDDWQPPVDVDNDEEEDHMPEATEDPVVEEVTTRPSQQVPESSRPPQSTNDFVKLLKETRKSEKENRSTSLFERQANAQRVEFGDGFDDSQPTPGPSKKGKEPQRSNPLKRARQVIEVSDNEDDEDDAFETEQRTSKVQQQRVKAKEAKRVRIDPSSTRAPGSSAAPTSHQPRARDEDAEYRLIENEELSEPEAPEMTEEAPPRSTLEDQRALARSNALVRPNRKPRRAKTAWTSEEEEALIAYMEQYPRQYAKIISIDKEGDALFFDGDEDDPEPRRTQVDLKDKARNLAKIMIKSGAGLRPGFDGVITPSMAAQLREEGWNW